MITYANSWFKKNNKKKNYGSYDMISVYLKYKKIKKINKKSSNKVQRHNLSMIASNQTLIVHLAIIIINYMFLFTNEKLFIIDFYLKQ